MTKIKKVGVLSMAKFHALLFAIIGLLAGLFIASLGPLFSAASKITGQSFPFTGLGVLAIIILPIVYGIMGFVGGAIAAVIYNLIARWIGGIEVELEQ